MTELESLALVIADLNGQVRGLQRENQRLAEQNRGLLAQIQGVDGAGPEAAE